MERADPLLVEHVADGCVLLRMNRKDAANAVDATMTAALQHALAWTEADPRVRVVVLGSAHPFVYCAGADLHTVASGNVAELFPVEFGFAGFVRASRRKPWIAMVGGAALAGGLETSRGLAALAGGVQRLPLRIPAAVAMDMILSGQPIDGQRAFQVGLVSRLTAPADLLAASLSLARTLAKQAPGAVRDSLCAARTALQLGEQAAWDMTPTLEKRRLNSDEFKEGMRAFVERRAPVWPEDDEMRRTTL